MAQADETRGVRAEVVVVDEEVAIRSCGAGVVVEELSDAGVVLGKVQTVDLVCGHVGRRIEIVVDRAVVRTAGNGEVGESEIALDDERKVVPLVIPSFILELYGVQVAEGQVEVEARPYLGLLIDDARVDRPVLVGLPAQVNASAPGGPVVDVVLDAISVVAVAVLGGIGRCGSEDVVDVAAFVLVEAYEAYGQLVEDECDIRDPAGVVGRIAFAHEAAFEHDGTAVLARVGLVGDDLERAGLRAGAVQGRLGT